jgi:hypothetical protein
VSTPRATKAYAAWHDAKRGFDAALPWTPEWLRLRLVEQELRSEWERLALDDDSTDADRSDTWAEDENAPTYDGKPSGSRRSGQHRHACGASDPTICRDPGASVAARMPRPD